MNRKQFLKRASQTRSDPAVPLLAWLSAALLCVAPDPAFGLGVSGRVFVDRNGDGVAGPDEPGAAGVAVADGRTVVLTSKLGDYMLEAEPGRFVFVSLPRGYRPGKSFYVKVDRDSRADFPLLEWPESREERVRFVQITDIHVTSNEDTVSTFREDIAEINGLQPRAVFALATGDLVNQGKNPPEFENYLRATATFQIPIFNLPGNHDARGSMPHYHRYLGPDYYSFNVGGCHVMMLNCLDFNAEQRSWIEKDLAVAPKRAARIFALHFLPTQEQVRYMAGLGGVAVLSGHWHGNRVARSQGVMDMNTPPLRFGGIDRHPRSFRIVEAGGGKLKNELRLGGFQHHGFVVSPRGACPPASGRLPIVVNAYDTRYDIAAVECEAAGRRIALKQGSPWTWIGELQVPAGLSGPQKISARIRAICGETWRAEAEFEAVASGGSQTRPVLTFKWAAPTGGFIGISSPRASARGIAIGVDDKGMLEDCGVMAFSAEGRMLWRFVTDSAIKNNIAEADGRYFATSVAGRVYALEQRSGRLLWKAEADFDRDERWETAATTVAGDRVYVGAHSCVAAFDAKTGGKVWEQHYGKTDWWPSCYPVPMVAGGRLLLATGRGFQARHPGTGQLLWEVKGKFSGCVPAGETIYTLMDGVIVALSAADGSVLWKGGKPIGDTASSPALCGDRLIVGAADGRVCAFSARDGALLWATQTGPSLSTLQPYKRGGSDVNSSPAVLAGTSNGEPDRVFVGASDGAVHVLAALNGAELGRYELGVPIASSPLISGDTLYVGAYDGNLYAFAIGR